MSGFYENITNDDYEAPQYESSSTPFANRPDTTQPYRNTDSFSERVAQAPVNIQEDKSYYSWWRFLTRQTPGNAFESVVFANFKRNDVTADNFDEYKDSFIKFYKEQL